VFTTPSGGLVQRQTIAKLVKEDAKTAGIEAYLGTHAGRRTVVTSLFVDGHEGLEDIARFVGHAKLGRVLIEAARAAARTKNTYLGAQYRRLAARRGPNKASVAVAHSMIVSAWHMLSTGETYRELGPTTTRDATTPNARHADSPDNSRTSATPSRSPRPELTADPG
jgi:hypothetical protein